MSSCFRKCPSTRRPYRYAIVTAELASIANHERKLPAEYVRSDGSGITPAAREYLEALVQGEAYPPYVNGLPDYVTLEKHLVQKRLPKMGILWPPRAAS